MPLRDAEPQGNIEWQCDLHFMSLRHEVMSEFVDGEDQQEGNRKMKALHEFGPAHRFSRDRNFLAFLFADQEEENIVNKAEYIPEHPFGTGHRRGDDGDDKKYCLNDVGPCVRLHSLRGIPEW